MKANTKTIKTYCYGELKEFNSIAEAEDGVPAPKKRSEPILQADVKRAKALVAEKKIAVAELDKLRAEIDAKQEQFNKENAELIEAVNTAQDKWYDIATELIRLGRKGINVYAFEG